MRRDATLVLLALTLACPRLAQAGEMTVIKYHLGGVMQVQNPVGFTMPFYSPGAPAPQNVQQPTGSMVTFQFESSGGVPLASGNVTILTYVRSNGITIPGLATGYNRVELNAPITGGHLNGRTAAGSGAGTGSNNGLFHCVASGAACYALLALPTFIVSYDLGRGANPQYGNSRFVLWTPSSPARPGRPIHFNGLANGPGAPPVRGAGWVFGSGFSTLTASRPFCTPQLSRPGLYYPCSYDWGGSGTLSLVGTEVGRTVLAPEPATGMLLPLLALLVLASARSARGAG